MTAIIETQRLILRAWKEEDVDPYNQINQDPKVIEFLPGPLTREQVQTFIHSMNSRGDKYGYTLWAVELKKTGELIGFIGLNYIDWESHFTPAIEVGWRLGSQFWGKGYATEGAKATLDYGFQKCGLSEIVAFTLTANVRSRRVMEKIGLKRHVKGDFAHPKLPSNHPLSMHILYRLTRQDYLQGVMMLKKQRIRLREPVLADENNFLTAIGHSKTLHHPWVAPPLTSQEFMNFIQRYQLDNQKSFLVCDQLDNIAGVFNINEIVRGLFQSAYLGFYAMADYAGRGYMSGGLQLILQKVFIEMNLHRLEANIQPENFRSINLVKNNGFRKEGYSTNYLKINGVWRDHERWAITVEDFNQK